MNKKALIASVITAFLLCLACIYFAGRYYFSSHYYPRSSINGVDVSMKSGEEALALVEDELNGYILKIKSAEQDMTISAEQSGLKYTGTEQIQKNVDQQDENYWFKAVFYEHKYDALDVTLDQAKLQETMNGLYCMNPTTPQQPVDAYIQYDDTKKEYVIVDEVIGNTVVPESLYAALEKAILAREDEVDMTTNEFYVQPKYFAAGKEATEAKATLDKYMSTVINYEDLGSTFTVTGEDIHNFIKVDKDFKITFDKETMKTFISEKISPVFNTVGQKRTIDSPGSGTFTAEGGTYGWQVGLIAERTKMIENIKAGGTVNREPEYIQDGAVKDKKNDIGDSYVDVSISDQKLWVVKKGKVVLESDFVSGSVASNHETHKGIFMVERKQKNYRMEDYNVTVKYWLPFNLDQGEGFHDASWRSSFGGSIYKSDGSHGCINLPPKIAKKMYEIIDTQFPVIVH